MSLGSQLKKYRKKKRYTQTDVAQKIKKSTSTVSKYEKGINEPSYKLLQVFADLYDCKVSDFFNQEFDETENI